MEQNSMQGRPGLHVEHLRQLVRLRKDSGWLGIAAVIALIAFYQLHRSEPALFEAAHTYAAHHAAGPAHGRAVAVSPFLN